MKKNGFKVATLSLLLILLVTSCATPKETTKPPTQTEAPEATEEVVATKEPTEELESEPIKIGFLGPMSGAGAYVGERALYGVKSAVQDINEGGGINGRLIEIIAEDTEGTPSVGVSALQKLVQQDEVVGIVGGAFSSVTFAQLEVLPDLEVPFVIWGASNPRIRTLIGEDLNEWAFHAQTDDTSMSKAYVKYIVEERGLTTHSVVMIDDDYGRSLAEIIQEELANYGAEVLSVDFFVRGETDFSTILSKISDLSPDGVATGGELEEISLIQRGLKEYNIEATHWNFGGVAVDPGFIDALGPELTEGVVGAMSWAPGLPNEKARKFRVVMQERFGEDPSFGSAKGYMAAQGLLEAMKSAESIDPVAIKDALETVSFETLCGTMEFGKDHASSLEITITEIQDGEIKIIETVGTGESK